MALQITDECINCDLCEPECPNGAIAAGTSQYAVDPALRTEVCPVDCVQPNPDHRETREILTAKARQLTETSL
jgi:NAD-dependent dihydropyrimidine dehydrogenase PreA subunit